MTSDFLEKGCSDLLDTTWVVLEVRVLVLRVSTFLGTSKGTLT